MATLNIIKPDDWHLHLRDSPFLETVVADSARQFARAIIMPNLDPPVRNCSDALAYRERILAALPADCPFNPLMTLYLTDKTSVDEIRAASESEFIHGAKLYPAGATTNSAAGVTNLSRIAPVFEAMQEHGLILQVHGEATAAEIDVFDREKIFIDESLTEIRDRYPRLRIVFEHITTREAVEFVRQADDEYLAATITAHHLLINRNALFRGGIRPHHYCLPVAKREHHRQALLDAASGGEACFFAGTDSAPHSLQAKESACGCAGIYSAYSALELYAEAFEQCADFSHLESFMSRNGADFYHLPYNTEKVVLERSPWVVPASLPYPESSLVPFMAGETLTWKLSRND
jgi:dihydroorotase